MIQHGIQFVHVLYVIHVQIIFGDDNHPMLKDY